MVWATTSFPVPVSPEIMMPAFVPATLGRSGRGHHSAWAREAAPIGRSNRLTRRTSRIPSRRHWPLALQNATVARRSYRHQPGIPTWRSPARLPHFCSGRTVRARANLLAWKRLQVLSGIEQTRLNGSGGG